MSQSNLQPSASKKLVDLGDVKFDNRFVRELPGDPETHNVRGRCATPAIRASILRR